MATAAAIIVDQSDSDNVLPVALFHLIVEAFVLRCIFTMRRLMNKRIVLRYCSRAIEKVLVVVVVVDVRGGDGVKKRNDGDGILHLFDVEYGYSYRSSSNNNNNRIQ